MYRVFYCLTVEHDLRLVAVATLLCLVSALGAVFTARRAIDASAERRTAWLLVAGFVTGVGIWGTHFVSMLAYEAPVAISYHLGGTIGSLALAIFVTSCGWALACRSDNAYAAPAGGAVVGAGVTTMHFMGIDAMQLGATIQWDAGLVIAAIVLGMQFAAGSAMVMARFSSKRGLLASAAMMAAGVVCLHFIAMGAMTLVPDASTAVGADDVALKLLAVTVALAVILIVGIGLFAAGLDEHLGARRRAEMQRMRTLADATFEGITVVRDGIMQDMNSRFCELLQLRREDLENMPVNKLIQTGELPSDGSEDGAPVTCRLRRRDGSSISVQVRRRSMVLDQVPADVFAFRDVSAEEHARARMAHLAHHDTLTGLPNRLKFRESFQSELKRAWARDSQAALIYFDLDRFKEVNDVHGHAVGDELLKTVSERMQDALPSNAIAARLSGDEFAVVLPDIASREDALGIAQRVVNSVGSPLTLGSLHLKVSASGGVTLFPLDGEDLDRLMNQADLALYRAKGLGRNQVCEFDPKLGQMMQERRLLETDLAMAIEDELLELNFQPQARLGDGKIVGFEALVRWNDDKRGSVPPSEFVQIAEETGLILKMGSWVLRAACREAMNWPEDCRVAVNVSPAQFRQGNLVMSVQQALAASGLAPERLEIEITEGVLIDDEERALNVLRALKQLGVGLAIDDFGTGYSSLSYLRAFPFDKIKIDRSFMTGLHLDREAQIIVQATIDLATELGIRVVVEGIEEFDELQALGAQPDLVLQGYLLSKPLTRGQLAGFAEASAAIRQEIADCVAGCAHEQRSA
ncbi:EAL domain-containing protein [Maricaulis parjimensis]|uniref:EAL domain-containing protein n=1 Tax=Maricaulis parjimensis TaxID=144023 RepID=UPI001939415A